MKTQPLRRWPVFIIGIAVLGILIGIGLISDVHAQAGKKIVKLAGVVKPQLKFTAPKVGQQDIRFGENFDTEPDWIKNLSFKLESISGKRIVFLNVNITFPESRLTGSTLSYRVDFGQRPGSPPPVNSRPMLLEPGETLNVSLDEEKDKISRFVGERLPFESIHEVELETYFVIFDDKTGWFAGTFVRQSPADPKKYNPIETEPQQ